MFTAFLGCARSASSNEEMEGVKVLAVVTGGKVRPMSVSLGVMYFRYHSFSGIID